MATPIKIIVYIVALIISVFILNKLIVMNLSDAVLRARILRFQLTIAILCFMSLLNAFVWRNLSSLLDSERHLSTDDTESEDGRWTFFVDFRDVSNWRTYTVNSLLWRVLLAAVQISSLLSYTSFTFLIHTEPYRLAYWLFLCFATVVQLFCGLVFLKVIMFIWTYFLKRRTRPKSTKFQRFAVVVYAVLIVTVGFYNISQPPMIKDVSIPIKDLPKDLNNLQITFVSDIHLGPTIGQKSLERIVNMINYLQSDVVIIGGDLVDGRVDQLSDAVESLEWIKSKYGVYFVTGNHEYYTTDAENWIQKLSTLGVTTLHNSNVKINTPGHPGFCLAGVDDPTADIYNYLDHGMDLDAALKSCDKSSPVILVAHQPESAKAALNTDYRVDLVLSGHTHGGQMFPITIGAYLFNPFYAGLYRHGDHSHVYVSMGTMYWGFPVRFLTQAEITKITLLSNK